MASIMLVAFALRALIPAGFMPASGRPFSLEICSEGFPAHMLAHGEPAHADSTGMQSMGMEAMSMGSMDAHWMGAHHSGSTAHSEHCVFGTACSAGLIPYLPLPSQISSAQQLRTVAFVSVAGDVHLVHLPQPRAPPARLS